MHVTYNIVGIRSLVYPTYNIEFYFNTALSFALYLNNLLFYAPQLLSEEAVEKNHPRLRQPSDNHLFFGIGRCNIIYRRFPSAHKRKIKRNNGKKSGWAWRCATAAALATFSILIKMLNANFQRERFISTLLLQVRIRIDNFLLALKWWLCRYIQSLGTSYYINYTL